MNTDTICRYKHFLGLNFNYRHRLSVFNPLMSEQWPYQLLFAVVVHCSDPRGLNSLNLSEVSTHFSLTIGELPGENIHRTLIFSPF